MVNRRTFVLALALTPGIGGRTIARIMSRNLLIGRTQDAFMRLGPEALRSEYRMTAAVAARWTATKQERLEEAERTEEKFDRFGVTLMTCGDAHYPQRLEAMDDDPPGVLYLYGNARLLEAQTFCVLSSRHSPPEALEMVDKLAERGILNAETLVSGHDTPEYQRSAVAPLRWGTPRILVLDCGMFNALGDELRDEPFRAARLWRYRFDAETDLAVSCVQPERDYHRASNAIRDKLIASLSMRLDFAWVAAGGNMHRLARLALKAGRAVRVSDLSPCARELWAAGAGRISAK